MGTIIVKDLGKAYKQYPNRWSRLLEWLSPFNKPRHSLNWVIQNINFIVQPGEAVGVLGINGAGKSTLLKMITGTTQPTTGSVIMSGRVAALLELGMGFHSDFTGRQNAFMAGQLLGLSVNEITILMPKIEAFAEIGDYIDQPVRIYSSGMQVRLAFSVATAIRPDILIVDEALSVGDAYFQHKSFERIREFQREGTTLLFVSHDLPTIRALCNKSLWLDSGHVKLFGNSKDVLDEYFRAIHGKSQVVESKIYIADNQLDKFSKNVGNPRDCRLNFINHSNFRNDLKVLPSFEKTSWGDGFAKIKKVLLLDKDKSEVDWLIGGEEVFLSIESEALQELNNVFVGFMVRDRIGQNIFGDNTHLSTLDNPIVLICKQTLIVSFGFRMPILPKGIYSITCAIASGTQSSHILHEWCSEAIFFESHNVSSPSGLVGVPMSEILIQS
jgi:lipopolysaccharide transport system ATP-binding protein